MKYDSVNCNPNRALLAVFKMKIPVRLQVLTAASMKMTVFWGVAPCSLVAERRFRSEYVHHHPEDGDSKHL
jgi:hypothetical protein